MFQNQIDKNGDYIAISSYDVHTVAGVLKLFFRECKMNYLSIHIREVNVENRQYFREDHLPFTLFILNLLIF